MDIAHTIRWAGVHRLHATVGVCLLSIVHFVRRVGVCRLEAIGQKGFSTWPFSAFGCSSNHLFFLSCMGRVSSRGNFVFPLGHGKDRGNKLM